MKFAKAPSLRVPPPLDPGFMPPFLWERLFQERIGKRARRPCRLLFGRPDGRVFEEELMLGPAEAAFEADNCILLERTIKFVLWLKGAQKVRVEGVTRGEEHLLKTTYAADGRRAFDAWFFGQKVYPGGFEIGAEVALASNVSEESPSLVGGHWNGCRIGFDLGGSDRKVAAVVDGEVVFAEEVRWDPYYQVDINYHLEGIRDSLRRAAAHLPRVDAIGGSAAGVYVDNEPRLGSLFRGIPEDQFESRVRPLFRNVLAEWEGVPFVLLNDGEVSALAGAQSMKSDGVLGLSFGTSMAAGYVGEGGHLQPWLNELAFAPIDFRADAAVDEWSGDRGCGVQYFSQQAVARLLPASGLLPPGGLAVPEQLVWVQERMKEGDDRAAAIFRTIGAYLGYAVQYYGNYYDLRKALLLGRVTSGEGGKVIVSTAEEVLDREFPSLLGKPYFFLPDEQSKRLGQAVVAASLPVLEGTPKLSS